MDGEIIANTYHVVRDSIIDIHDIRIEPEKGHDEFGAIASGTLRLRGFIFEIRNFRGRRDALNHESKLMKECKLDFEDELINFSKSLYFMSLADRNDYREDSQVPSIGGIYLQLSNPENSTSIFQRVGIAMDIRGGGDGHMLDVGTWNYLCRHYKSGLRSYGTDIQLI